MAQGILVSVLRGRVLDVAVDIRTQVEDMRNQAVQLCGAGNEQEGIDILSEAKAMLAVD